MTLLHLLNDLTAEAEALCDGLEGGGIEVPADLRARLAGCRRAVDLARRVVGFEAPAAATPPEIPRRISVVPGDPGYRCRPGDYAVFLNDERLEDCVTADVERGLCLVYLRDGSGEIITTPDGTGFATYWKTGKVEICFAEGVRRNG